MRWFASGAVIKSEAFKRNSVHIFHVISRWYILEIVLIFVFACASNTRTRYLFFYNTLKISTCVFVYAKIKRTYSCFFFFSSYDIYIVLHKQYYIHSLRKSTLSCTYVYIIYIKHVNYLVSSRTVSTTARQQI